MNNSDYFSQETRERVEAAIVDLGYVPNTLARGLRSKRTHTLALVVTDITNPFFTVIARGVEDTASKAGFAVIYGNTDESEPEEYKYAQIMAQKQVDGVLLVPACSNAKSVEFLQSNDIPVVLIDRIVPNVEADVVRCDSEGGAYQLTRLLLDLGHEKITMITGPQGISTSDDRVAGYRRALAEAGLAEYDCVYYGAYTQASGYRLAEQVLNHTPLRLHYSAQTTSFQSAP